MDDISRAGETQTSPTPSRKRTRKWPFVLLGSILLFGAMYCTFVFSDIPAISELRTIYIETAMSTMTHQWLATRFIPASVINATMEDIERQFEDNLVEASHVSREPLPIYDPLILFPHINDPETTQTEETALTLSVLFPEIDMETMPEEFLDQPVETLQEKDIAGLGIKTTAGDAIWAIDVPNQILICEVRGDGYVGKLAFVKDSSRVVLAVNDHTDRGRNVTEFCEEYDAVLGINASGFDDSNGKGNGLRPGGLVLSDGVIYNKAVTDKRYQMAGYDYNNDLRVGYGLDTDELRDAMQFYPILVVDGQAHASGTYGLGLHPRSVIGQTADRTTLMLIIDGRQVGYSVGTTIGECVDIMLRYDCWVAMNMDGGSSASMTYMGEMITRTSSPTKTGRYLPDAWVVRGK